MLAATAAARLCRPTTKHIVQIVHSLSISSAGYIGVTFGGYGGYAYPPLFGVGGTIPPTFQGHERKITVTVPEHTLKIHYSSFNRL